MKLEPYQIVQATVAEGGIEKVVLNLKQHGLTVETKVPLKSGQNLNLQVIETHPKVLLRIVGNEELRHFYRILRSLDKNIKLLPIIEQLQQPPHKGNVSFFQDIQGLLSSFALLLRSNPEKLTGKNLSRFWEKMGLNLEVLLAEAKMDEAKANFKAIMLIYLKEAQKQGIMTESIENVLDLLTLFQLCRYRLAQENLLFFPLPFPFLEQGYFLAEKQNYPEQKGINPDQNWKMTLYLKLSHLDNLQIFLLFEKNTLRLRILCDSEEKVKIISESLTRLQNHLSTVELIGFSVGTGAEDPFRNLVKSLAPEGNYFLRTEA